MSHYNLDEIQDALKELMELDDKFKQMEENGQRINIYDKIDMHQSKFKFINSIAPLLLAYESDFNDKSQNSFWLKMFINKEKENELLREQLKKELKKNKTS